MNSKTTQRYNLIISIAGTEPSSPVFASTLAELCSNDFQTAFEMWEYTLAKYQTELADKALCEHLEINPFAMFLQTSETKTKQLFCESTPLQKLVYGNCATAGTGNNFVFLIGLILTNKIDIANECLAKLRSNPNVDFNQMMLDVVDTVFSTYCAKNNVKVPVLNKKQIKLLLSYVEKLKGPNKALLTQRLKEL